MLNNSMDSYLGSVISKQKAFLKRFSSIGWMEALSIGIKPNGSFAYKQKREWKRENEGGENVRMSKRYEELRILGGYRSMWMVEIE